MSWTKPRFLGQGSRSIAYIRRLFSGNMTKVPHVPWSRRIHRVMAPFVIAEDLGIASVYDFFIRANRAFVTG
jgi:hypothetical protein